MKVQGNGGAVGEVAGQSNKKRPLTLVRVCLRRLSGYIHCAMGLLITSHCYLK